MNYIANLTQTHISELAKFDLIFDANPGYYAWIRNDKQIRVLGDCVQPTPFNLICGNEFVCECIKWFVLESSYTHTQAGLGKYINILGTWYVFLGFSWVVSIDQTGIFIPKEISNQEYKIYPKSTVHILYLRSYKLEHYDEKNKLWLDVGDNYDKLPKNTFFRIKNLNDIVTVGNVSFKRGLTEEEFLKTDQDTYFACTFKGWKYVAVPKTSASSCLRSGRLHLTKEEAIAHSEALIKINKGEI